MVFFLCITHGKALPSGKAVLSRSLLVDGYILFNGFLEVGQKDMLVGRVGRKDRTRAADSLPPETGKVRGVAAERSRLDRDSLHFAEEAHGAVAAEGMDDGAGPAYSQKFVVDEVVSRESRPEVDVERDFGAQDVPWIAALEHAHVPGGVSQDLVLREIRYFQEVHELDEPLDGADSLLRITRVAGLPGKGDAERLRPLALGDEAVVGRLADQDEIPAGTVPGVGLRSLRTGLLPAQEKQPEIAVALPGKGAAGLVHGYQLSFGVAASPAHDHRVVGEGDRTSGQGVSFLHADHLRPDVRRHGVHVRAEHERRGTGAGPVEKKVGSPVADIVTVDFATGALQVFSKEPGKGGFRSGGGADAQYLQEKIKVHYTTVLTECQI